MSTKSNQPIDVVVTLNEINEQHGTGPLVKRVLNRRSNLFSIRTRSDWGGRSVGNWSAVLPQSESRPEAFRRVLKLLGGRAVGSVLCVPFLPDELTTSIAIQAAFRTSLCCWIMDDQNIAVQNVPDKLMDEFLERCVLRLVTHEELRDAYQRKYGLPFHLLPAVVPARLVSTEPCQPEEAFCRERRGALIGSFWDQAWFERTCTTLASCASSIDWYGNNWSPWFSFSEQAMSDAGLCPHGLVEEDRLSAELRRYPFVLVPAGSLDDEERNTGVARLSLPGRILFAMATAHTPTIVLGSPDTCAGRFVRHFDVGQVVPYDSHALSEAIENVTAPAEQNRLRHNAARVAKAFSDADVGDWLAKSIQLGAPADSRFEDAFRDYDHAAVSRFVDASLDGPLARPTDTIRTSEHG